MHFVYPHAFWLLLVIPLVVTRRLRGTRSAAIRFPNLQGLQDLPTGASQLAERVSYGTRLTMMILLVVGLARPRWPVEETRIPARSHAIQMVVDISGSMAERDFLLEGQPVSRLEAVKHAFRLFLSGGTEGLSGRGDDLVGLLTFSARSEDVCPPTLSHAVILRMLAESKPQGVPPDSSTNIGDALAEGLSVLGRAKPSEKFIILLSDGEHNVPPEVVPNALKPRQAAQIAKGLGIRIYAIYVGPHSVTSSPSEGEQAMHDVAAITGGQAFAANDVQSLLEVCRDIDQRERTRVESFHYYRYHEAYPWIGLICLLLYVSLFGIEGIRWLRTP